MNNNLISTCSATHVVDFSDPWRECAHFGMAPPGQEMRYVIHIDQEYCNAVATATA